MNGHDGREWDETAKLQACEAIFDAMCEGMSTTQALARPLMPSASTFARWRAESPKLQERYARAREALADFWADEVVPISDTAKDSDSAAAARVRIDARRWHTSKLAPATYADNSLAIGGNGQGGLTIVLNRYEAAPQVEQSKPKLIEQP
jgi:hypothetical protein